MRASPRILSTAVLWSLAAAALAQDGSYDISDGDDADALERVLFLCQWQSGREVPDGATAPQVCNQAALSTDEAVHEGRLWWMYCARAAGAEKAAQAKVRFNDDFMAFQKRQAQDPDLAQELLPQGTLLPRNDWRVRLVQRLVAHARSLRAQGAAR